jgi:hypothetical protein
VQVLADYRLVIPDRPGNRRLDGMRNVLTNPRIGPIAGWLCAVAQPHSRVAAQETPT